MKLFPFPLRLTIPAILLVMGFLAGGFSYQKQVSLAHKRAEEDLTQHARLTATSMAQLLEYLYRRTDIQNSQSEGVTLVVSRLTGDLHLSTALFCDEQNRISNASRFELINRKLEDTPFKRLAPVAEQVQRSRSGQVVISPDRRSIQAVYPVSFPPPAGELRSRRVGFVVLDYNLTRSEQRAIADARKQSLQTIGVLAGLGLLVGFVLDRIVTQRAGRLVFASDQLAEGNLHVRAHLEGSDELAQISTAFNRMATQLQQDVEVRQASEQQLKKQAEQLESALRELGRTQSHLVQQEKMSSLGQLVAGVAHEINNPVNFIHGNLTHIQTYAQDLLGLVQRYQQHYPQPIPEIEAELEEIDLEFLQGDLPKLLFSMKIGTDRIREIVLSLRNFSRMDEAEIKPVNLHEGIESTLLILQHRLKANSKRSEIEVVKDFADLPLVECYAGQLNQVFMNILSNAIDALDEQQEQHTKTATPSQITIRTARKGADWVQIMIADNGPGIAEENQQRIFDPFFTTKPIGKGTGMGMSISYQIVTEKHGGQLECSSTPGYGTKFLIQIPTRHAVVSS